MIHLNKIISWSEVTSVWSEVTLVWSEVTSIMGRSDFSMAGIKLRSQVIVISILEQP